MPERRMVEIDGKRHDITDIPITYELTCDWCEEYAKHIDLIRLNGTLFVPDGRAVPVNFAVHPKHVDKVPHLIEALIGEQPPF